MKYTINTKSLFISLIKEIQSDLILDIGSRDGLDALFFKHSLPKSEVIAFEANPILFEKMISDEILVNNNIKILPYAVSNKSGTAKFHITDVDYSKNDTSDHGTSSLYIHPNLTILKSVDVKTIRLDEYLNTINYQKYNKIAAWIDVEGLEFSVLQGIDGLRDRIKVIHIETAKKAMRYGQKNLAEITQLLKKFSFEPIGTNIRSKDNWGDVVFISKEIKRNLGSKLLRLQMFALFIKHIKINAIIAFLRKEYPNMYRLLGKIYTRLV